MSNIHQLNEILRGLDDGALQQQMQAPAAGVPQYMVLAEMQRRAAMRKEAQPVAPAPVSTVADDVQAEMGGVAAMPQMAQGEEVPDGGVVGYAGGGEVDEKKKRGFPYSNYPSGGPSTGGWNADSPLGRYFDRVQQQFTNSFGFPGASTAATAGGYVPQEALGAPSYDIDPNEDTLWNRANSYVRDANAQFKHEANKAYGVWTDPFDTNPKPEQESWERRANVYADEQAKFPPRVKDLYPEQPRVTNAKAPAKPTTVTNADPALMVDDVDNGGDRVGGGGGARGAPGAGYKTPSYSPSAQNAQFAVGDYSEKGLSPLELKSYKDYLEEVAANAPDNYGELMARADQRIAQNDKGRKDALAQGLMEAGLGIMAAGGRNGSFLGAIGEGGIGGMRSYAQAMKDVRARGDQLEQGRDRLAIAQAEAKAGRFKTAADMANNENTRRITMRGQDRAAMADRMRMEQADRQLQFQGRKMDEQMKYNYDKLGADVEMEKAKVAATLKAAGIRAAGSGGKSGKTPAGIKEVDIARVTKELKANGVMQNPGESPEAFTDRLRAMAIMRLGGAPAALGIGGMQQKPTLTMSPDGTIK